MKWESIQIKSSLAGLQEIPSFQVDSNIDVMLPICDRLKLFMYSSIAIA
ncbi:hypothetical protein [Chlorogloea sp. CCALA 695]|nr:hypothetical protein [Chlorogloea sp. CCALA 695]